MFIAATATKGQKQLKYPRREGGRGDGWVMDGWMTDEENLA
jgi:hypothetical protein